jgi:thiamine-monophosphate kinase
MSGDLGPGAEFDRIRRIVAELGSHASGIGDDCATLADGPGTIALSTDLSIEDVHFKTEWLSFREIGWRAAASALSDLAAEGASAIGILVSLGVPAGAGDSAVVELMAGAGQAVHSVGGALLGGDLSRSDKWLVNVTVVGRAMRPVSRSGARAGESLWVTGSLGGSRAALNAWLRGEQPAAMAREAFARPVPRIHSGVQLALLGATAMLDISDGLGGDAAHLAAASSCGLEIDLSLLPIHPDVPAAATLAGVSPGEFAGLGGEDFELLVVMPATFSSELADRLARETGVPLTRIGGVMAGPGVRFLHGGNEVRLTGFDHFSGLVG